jgi:aspartyl/glutamyl-tRNA(Asn/Gln) amidotransferase C subunit
MDKDKVLSLAKLARIKLSDEEALGLSHEFESILNYVGEVKGIENLDKVANFDKEDFLLHNIFRNDNEMHESGIYTEKLLNEAPGREGNYIKVKKIL